MKQTSKVKIPENQRRSLSVTAHNIEKSLEDIENILTAKKRDKLTEKIIKNMSDNEREEILKLIKIVRNQNEDMFNELELEGTETFEDRYVRSRVGQIWTLLCDSTPESLKTYGNITNEQALMIRKHVNKLLNTVNKLQSIVFKNNK